MTDEPLIHTSKGNLPVDSLTYSHGFDFQSNGLVFWEEHRLGDEIVKRSAHAYVLPIGTKMELHGGNIG